MVWMWARRRRVFRRRFNPCEFWSLNDLNRRKPFENPTETLENRRFFTESKTFITPASGHNAAGRPRRKRNRSAHVMRSSSRRLELPRPNWIWRQTGWPVPPKSWKDQGSNSLRHNSERHREVCRLVTHLRQPEQLCRRLDLCPGAPGTAAKDAQRLCYIFIVKAVEKHWTDEPAFRNHIPTMRKDTIILLMEFSIGLRPHILRKVLDFRSLLQQWSFSSYIAMIVSS